MSQELSTMEEAAISGFDEYGLSATVQFTSEDYPSGSMATYLVRGMVSCLVRLPFSLWSVVRFVIKMNVYSCSLRGLYDRIDWKISSRLVKFFEMIVLGKGSSQRGHCWRYSQRYTRLRDDP